MTTFDVVVPTIGRPSLSALLDALFDGPGPGPSRVVLVDDRPVADRPLLQGPLPRGVTVLRSGGRGPAAARNVGWRAGSAEWVAFLDDDVVPEPGWCDALTDELARLPDDVGASPVFRTSRGVNGARSWCGSS
jgi:glycosyltransferase involved in cell wall biosynthesis